jgi:hypothetical protein
VKVWIWFAIGSLIGEADGTATAIYHWTYNNWQFHIGPAILGAIAVYLGLSYAHQTRD